jgi:hypothetical protein
MQSHRGKRTICSVNWQCPSLEQPLRWLQPPRSGAKDSQCHYRVSVHQWLRSVISGQLGSELLAPTQRTGGLTSSFQGYTELASGSLLGLPWSMGFHTVPHKQRLKRHLCNGAWLTVALCQCHHCMSGLAGCLVRHLWTCAKPPELF